MGFVGETADSVKWLGMTCAACHTAELHVNNVAYRVDGAPTQANVQALISDMIVAVKNTVDDPAKFDRFAAKVLAGKNDAAGQAELKGEDRQVAGHSLRLQQAELPRLRPDTRPPPRARSASAGSVSSTPSGRSSTRCTGTRPRSRT